ncbi:Uncharacterized protein Rs2_40565 [Raphanus sativus]|nr:Uncharacterized protein Rs2_40565 [Raphanus sativus]
MPHQIPCHKLESPEADTCPRPYHDLYINISSSSERRCVQGDAAGLELLHLGGGKEFWQLMKLTSKNASGFTSLLELPLTQAVELLHFNDSSSLLEGIARSSVIAHKLGTFYSDSNLDRVNTEPGETDSSQPLVSDQEKITRQEARLGNK